MNKIDDFLFNIRVPRGDVKAGSLLVSEPFLRESYFNHSVICLIEYGGKGVTSMGVVLNKPTDYFLSDLIDGVTRNEPVRVYCGGPVSVDRLYCIHSLGEEIFPGATKICDGLYIGGDFSAMIDYVNSGYPLDGNIRFFLGYSGWDAGQLDSEIADNVWAVAQIASAPELLSGPSHGYWHGLVRQMGADYRGWMYHPHNPRWN